jgi:hypothetical protein
VDDHDQAWDCPEYEEGRFMTKRSGSRLVMEYFDSRDLGAKLLWLIF